MGRLLADHNILVDGTIPDYEILIDYITNVLNGDLSDYYEPEGRITIE